jgi:hypothetical protein
MSGDERRTMKSAGKICECASIVDLSVRECTENEEEIIKRRRFSSILSFLTLQSKKKKKDHFFLDPRHKLYYFPIERMKYSTLTLLFVFCLLAFAQDGLFAGATTVVAVVGGVLGGTYLNWKSNVNEISKDVTRRLSPSDIQRSSTTSEEVYT